MAHFNRRSNRSSQTWTTQQYLDTSRSWAFVAGGEFERAEAAGSDEWTPEKLIRMSNSLGLFYTGL